MKNNILKGLEQVKTLASAKGIEKKDLFFLNLTKLPRLKWQMKNEIEEKN